MAISLRGVASSTGSTITAPAGIAAGDLIILNDVASNNAGNPTDVTPTGFTLIGTSLSNGLQRNNLSYKFADGTEGSSSITGMNGTNTNSKSMLVFNTAGAKSFVLSTPNEVASTANPSPQTVSASGGTPPLVVIGAYGSNPGGDVSPRTFTVSAVDAKDGEINEDGATSGTTGQSWLAYKIYNSSPADVSVDMDDEGTNYLHSLYISAVPYTSLMPYRRPLRVFPRRF